VNSVSINGSGYGIIGGQDNVGDQYAALVDQTAVAMPLSLGPMGTGLISAVAINNSRQALISGSESGAIPHLALVSPTGVVTPVAGLPIVNAIITVDINESGNGIWGGTGGAAVHAGLVSSTGVLTLLTGFVPSGGSSHFQSVSINNSGAGIIGGNDAAFNAYAALVSPSGVATALTGDTPGGFARIGSVSINDSGAAIISGTVNGTRYVAVVSPSGVATRLTTGDLATSDYDSVSINNTGTSLIGGSSGGATYQARLDPGSLSPVALTGALPVGAGDVRVAINDSGGGIIGGRDNGSTTPFARLVSPSGVVTAITGALPVGTGIINSVSVGQTPSPTPAPSPILNALTPSTIGPAFGAPMAHSMLSASLAAVNHADAFHKWGRRKKGDNPALSLLAESDLAFSDTRRSRSMRKKSTPPAAIETEKKSDDPLQEEAPRSQLAHYPEAGQSLDYGIWAAPFYNGAYLSAQGAFPSSNIQTAGVLVGFDYWRSENLVIGAGAAYSYNYVGVNGSIGHGSINEGMLAYFTSYKGDYVFMNGSLWGGYYHLDSERHTLGFITSETDTHGWLLNPHLELCFSDYSKQSEWLFIEGFAMADWVNNWQSGYTETGRAGFNLIVPSLYNSLLRSEAGLTFYQTLTYDWGRIFLKEQASYINLAPFRFNPATTAFVGSVSTFTIATGTDHMLNLAGAKCFVSWIPNNERAPFGQIGVSGQFGSSYQSYSAMTEIGKNF